MPSRSDSRFKSGKRFPHSNRARPPRQSLRSNSPVVSALSKLARCRLGTKDARNLADAFTGNTLMAIDTQEEAAVFRAVLETLPTGVYIVDCEGKILFWNEGAERITGYLRQEVLGKFCRDEFLGHADAYNNVLTGAAAPIASAMREGRATNATISLRHKLGHAVPVRLRAVPVKNSQGEVIGAAESFESRLTTSHRDRRQTKLAVHGCTDEATGILNHAYMETQIREHLDIFVQHLIPFGILCIQVDQLDQLRMKYGAAGIAPVLRVVARTLEVSLRPTDFVGRWNDHQFLAIATECNETELLRAGERLKKMVGHAETEWWGDVIHITASFGGAATFTGDTTESIVARAETALEESIALGGDRIVVKHR